MLDAEEGDRRDVGSNLKDFIFRVQDGHIKLE
jgi:hypothetical protein